MLAKQHKMVLNIKFIIYIPAQQGNLLLKIQEKNHDVGIITCNMLFLYTFIF